jgi:hypothetical protein
MQAHILLESHTEWRQAYHHPENPHNQAYNGCPVQLSHFSSFGMPRYFFSQINSQTWVKGEKIDRRDPGMDPAQQEKFCNTISSPFKRV